MPTQWALYLVGSAGESAVVGSEDLLTLEGILEKVAVDLRDFVPPPLVHSFH